LTKLILVRHGLTAWNTELKYQGQSDIALSEEGLRQATLVAGRLANEKVAAVYSSDLSRAFTTAMAVADRHGLTVTGLPALREVHFGEWEGLTYKAISAGWPEQTSKLYTNPDEIAIPGGETFHQLKDRAVGAIAQIVARHPDETVVVVSHGATIRTIICALLGIHFNHLWEIKQDNTAVNIIEYYDGRGMIALINDSHHLVV